MFTKNHDQILGMGIGAVSVFEPVGEAVLIGIALRTFRAGGAGGIEPVDQFPFVGQAILVRIRFRRLVVPAGRGPAGVPVPCLVAADRRHAEEDGRRDQLA